MSSISPNVVYKGFWVNWSEGRVLGATITTSDNVANVLVAFLAILVATSGARLWNILVFTFYQFRATRKARDALFYQQQTLLRNVSSPTSIIIDFSKLAWHWRNKTRGSLRRSLFAIVPAFLCAVGFLVAGIFSSNVIWTSDVDVLVRSPNCGFLAQTSSKAQTAELQYAASNFATTLRYADLCYGNRSSSLCNVYSRQQISSTAKAAPCPWGDSICSEKDQESAAMVMDTGLIDMNEWFGINTPSEHHVHIRKKSTCAPITLDNHVRIVNVSDTNRATEVSLQQLPGDQEVQFYYGRPTGIDTNLTLGTTTYASNKTYSFTTAWQDGYVGDTKAEHGSFEPIPALNRSDADTVMIIIFGNLVNYLSPVDDVVFKAHKENWVLLSQGYNETFFISDNPAGIITCAEQYQFCNPNAQGESACTDVTGLIPATEQVQRLNLNPLQKATLNLFTKNVYDFSADMTSVGVTQPPPLKIAKYQVTYGGIPFVPDDQWRTEVVGFMHYVLSIIQKLVTDHAIGPGNPEWNEFITPITDESQKQLCDDQKMRAPDGFSNLSVFGLSITIAFCGLIILADLVGVVLVKSLAERGRITLTGMNQWNQDGTLQLQRKVYESLGETEWDGADTEVPTTLADKHLSDPEAGFVFEKHEKKSTSPSDGSMEDINVDIPTSDASRNHSTTTEETRANSETHVSEDERPEEEDTVPSHIESRSSTFPTQPPPERGIPRTFSHHSEISSEPKPITRNDRVNSK